MDEACVATSPVGAPGTVSDEEDVGVAEASPDAAPVPAEDIAETLYVYVVPVTRPVCEYVVVGVPVFETIVV